MLPIVDKPAVQYVVEEAARADILDVLIVSGRHKGALEDHFDRHWELEQALERKKDWRRLQRVTKSADLGDVHFIRQGEPRGPGHAVLCARCHVGDQPFAVMLGDDLIDEHDHLLEQMIGARARHGGSVLALMKVPSDQLQRYGCAEVEPIEGEENLVRVTSLVEKPAPGEIDSNLAIIGRYILDPAVFAVLERTPPGRSNEIQLTDALHELAGTPPADGGGVTGVIFDGARYDTGDRLEHLKATVLFGVRHPDVGDDFRRWLNAWVTDQSAS